MDELDLEFENIVPWNGEVDTGRDARLKLDRNFARIKNNLDALSKGSFIDLGGIPESEFDNVTKQGYYLYALQAGTGDRKGILVVSNDGDIRQIRYEFDGTYTRSRTDEGWEEWTDEFVSKLRKHIDNATIYWDDANKVIKARGGGNDHTIVVSIDVSSIGKCSVTTSGDGSVSVNADKSQYTVVVPVAGTVTVNIVAKDGYQVQSLMVDNVSKGNINSFSFENVQEEHTMYVVMEIVEENPTNFLVRNDLPNVYYSSTQSAVDAIKTAYPNGLTQNITLTCIKPATEKRLSGTWIAELSKWNEKSICCLIIDGADRLVYDGKSLGGLQFKEVNNVLLRNISFVNCANYAGAYSPSELYALNFVGSASRNARNLMAYKCCFNGVYPSDLTKKAWRTIGSKYSENLTLLGCDISNDYGNCMKLTNCQYVSLIKNTISVDYSLGVVAHPSIMTLKNCYTLNVEDNKMSGDVRENYFELSNVDRFYFLRNEVSGGGGRAITMSSLGSMKEVVVDSNLFVGMLNGPAGGWMKEYINLGTAKIDRLCMNNNTCYMSGKFYEQYITKGGTVEDAYIYNNIAINATGTSTNSINGFIINRVKSLHTGNNLYESMRGLVVSPNADGESDYITVDWTTGRDVAKLQAAGYEANSIKVEDGTKLLEKQNGGDSYKLIEGLEYYSNMSYFPDADIEYKAKANKIGRASCRERV